MQAPVKLHVMHLPYSVCNLVSIVLSYGAYTNLYILALIGSLSPAKRNLLSPKPVVDSNIMISAVVSLSNDDKDDDDEVTKSPSAETPVTGTSQEQFIVTCHNYIMIYKY